ncbi:MAG: Uma2 family endonuclease [Planctomycetota bacterium]
MAIQNLLTARQFERISAALGPCELERGEVVPLAPGGPEHSEITTNITFLLSLWARRMKRGRVWTAEPGLVTATDPDTVRGVDVIYYSYKRVPRGMKFPPGFSRFPPELAVEIIGKGQGWRKMVEKAGEYLRMGVDRVWIVDPRTRRVHVLRPDAEPRVFSTKDKLTDPQILPGFRAAVSAFFEQ